jgi:hypothetical protein
MLLLMKEGVKEVALSRCNLSRGEDGDFSDF